VEAPDGGVGSLIWETGEPAYFKESIAPRSQRSLGIQCCLLSLGGEALMPVLSLPGTELYYEVGGDGPAAVLIHGMGLDTRMWDDQIPALEDIATLVRLDVRGHGRSSRASDVAYAHADDIWALADHLGVATVDLLGLSMGGMIAVRTYFAAPERVRSLVLIDSVIDEIPFDADTEADFAALESALADGGMPAARKAWLESGLFAPAMRQPAVAARLAQMVEDYGGLDWRNDDPHLPRQPLYSRLASVHVPTTVIVASSTSRRSLRWRG
jgi:3-oxoadipate enol-lactonase